MPVVELKSGPVAYADTGGQGPVIVLCHGLPMDHRAWRKVAPLLGEFRVIMPTLPIGGHRLPMRADAELGQLGVARILGDFLDALEVSEVTLVLNDWGGGQYLINQGRAERVGRLVLAACEAFDNFPPGPAKILGVAASVPGGLWLVLQGMRLRPLRRMRGGYGGMSVVGIPDDLLRDWFLPAQESAEIRRDFAKFAAGNPTRAQQLTLAEGWSEFRRPVLVVWADRDPLMPAEHGPRLASLYPDARLEVLENCSTLVGEDQPERFAQILADFVRA
ncbi:MAG: alpha/beta hydrolase [Propionibacteriaceae bacterium]|nr:alpha/beta hydrolase [Propionibacteriaceae bacterium]